MNVEQLDGTMLDDDKFGLTTSKLKLIDNGVYIP